MPFLEINDFDDAPRTRHAVSVKATEIICDVYKVDPEIVSIYFFKFDEKSYSHAGIFPAEFDKQRIFIKLHAYPRPIELRKEIAKRLTSAVSMLYGVPDKKVAIYFFDREPAQVSHGGSLQADV